MELQIAGTNMELSPVVNRYIERKLGKLSRHLPTIMDVKVEVSEEKTKSPQQQFLVRVTVNGGVGGVVFHGEERGEDPLEAVDKVADIMTRQLERHKGKLYDKGRGNSLARAEFDEAAGPVGKIVKNKRFTLESMSVEEAIEQMENLKHSFFLFYDAEADEIKLVYRRNDGNYGLIETEKGEPGY
jgi:putative sigma-54 modulation protein